MAAIINVLIPEQNYQKVRDRLGVILSEELAQQKILNADVPECHVFVERYHSLQQKEFPAILISTDGGSYDNATIQKADGSYTYFIDIYTNSASSDSVNGYTLASQQLHQLIGLVRAILMFGEYKTLDMERGIVQRVEIKEWFVVEKEVTAMNKGILLNDAKNNCIARMVLQIRVKEDNLTNADVALNSGQTVTNNQIKQTVTLE